MMYEHLTKAKEVIKKLIEAIHIWDCKNLEEVEAELGQELEINMNNGAALLQQLFRLPEEDLDDFDADFDDEDYCVICEYIEEEEEE